MANIKNKKVLYFGIGAVALIGTAVALYFLLKKDKAPTINKKTTLTEDEALKLAQKIAFMETITDAQKLAKNELIAQLKDGGYTLDSEDNPIKIK